MPYIVDKARKVSRGETLQVFIIIIILLVRKSLYAPLRIFLYGSQFT